MIENHQFATAPIIPYFGVALLQRFLYHDLSNENGTFSPTQVAL